MSKLNVAIVTITDGCNYGNRLQNYALQTALQKLDVESETLKRKNYHDDLWLKIKTKCKTFVKMVLGMDRDAPKRERKRKFDAFNTQYMHFSRYTLQKNRSPQRLSNKYDAFFVGSDQVWNPMLRLVREDIDNYFAAFASKEKKFSYAASFGISAIPDQYKDYYREKLNSFARISVREEQGVEIVRNLCSCPAESVCDPTLLLTTEEWDAIMEQPKWEESAGRYLVTYILGEIPNETREQINHYAKTHNLKIIPLQSEFVNSKKIENTDSFAASPQEFLWLISHSHCVLTDSFHACVFSILYRRPFQVFDRKAFEANNEMGSRIESLLSKFALQNRRSHGTLEELLLSELQDDGQIETVLRKEREKGYSFLQECLQSLSQSEAKS